MQLLIIVDASCVVTGNLAVFEPMETTASGARNYVYHASMRAPPNPPNLSHMGMSCHEVVF